ncbi:hypothetical protein [Streptomyces daghestanicus]|uniref:Uncharacterized protein n=1 Tax=Streptomyces daghestanicus TaxID=66885 RepID=A0ABQ3Q7H5_9ACTN|nr:hypothetical protein [Streptomyces daghestanicus]GGU66344.1 hypothetical protein GCM10010259_65780 [Streptomyces daghestanicus]GHI33238.1 hypothetical protein Sdagh_49680 [Streptomyces daghestanicus]
MTEETSKLDELAAAFADDLTALTRGVLGDDTPRFAALNMGKRVRVSPISADETELRIPVSINSEPVLSLKVRYFCCWDGTSTFLATDQADVHIHYAGITDPLIRFEYVRDSKEPPGAHIQVHAHRDEMAYLLRLADAGRPKQGLRRRRLPRLSEMHIPVGGHRMRPALEDVLLFLKREFAIDTVQSWRTVIEERLRTWREIQLMSAVRDAPEAAADVLRALGYEVKSPTVIRPRASHDDVKLYWP